MRVNVRFDADYAEDYVGNLLSGTLERVPQLGELAYSGQRYSAVDVPYGAAKSRGSSSKRFMTFTDTAAFTATFI